MSIKQVAFLLSLSLGFGCESLQKLFQPDPTREAPAAAPASIANNHPLQTLPPTSAVTPPTSAPNSTATLETPLFTPKSHPELLGKLSDEDTDLTALQTAPQADPASISKEGLPASLPSFAGVKETGYRVSYVKSKSPYFDSIREVMEQQKLFEAVAESLNQTFTLPRVVEVQLTDCGMINAFYEPKTYRLIMCYEMIGSFIELFKPLAKTDEELFANVFGGTFFVFLHEAGHSLVHLLHLPITGKEEDAVDQLATIVLLMGGEDGVNAALAAAQRFYISGERAISRGLPYWDEHSLGQQRFYNIACLIFGSNPEKYLGLVKESLLPQGRAVRCDAEFAQASNSWRTLLTPYMKENAAQPTLPASLSAKLPSPPPEAPSEAQAACEGTSDHVINLIMQEASRELSLLPKEEASEARQELLDRVLTMSAELTETCVTKPWPLKLQGCIKQATSRSEAEECLK